MTQEQLAFSDATTLGSLIAKKKISSVELTDLYLARLEKYGSTYGAVVTIMHDRALREARSADRELASGKSRGPLHGVPYGAKDLLAAVGAPTTWGAAPYRNQVFNYDATVVQRLRAAGAVLLAKLAMVELAGGFRLRRRRCVVHRPGQNAVEPRLLERWIFERPRSRRCSGVGRLCDRI